MSSGGHSGASPPYGNSASLLGRHHQFIDFMSSTSSSAVGDTFTPQMRDRQARGQDPYHSGDVSDDGDFNDAATKLRLGNGRTEKEDFFKVERRQKAIAFLDNPELLMMYAQSTGDSIAAARLYWTKVLCGYEDEPEKSAKVHK
ncbi:cecdcb10-78c0-46c6-b0b7-dd05d15faac3 [Achaetomium macrosporum]|uniref:Cecdcb10-78c0-46c6-b0b7-dd05d15faac3 n=1 Tax=Achaetomium macrosporum TaxID=79813 RepID=A0AAN7CHU5_9PEZI|nr:cecdcb10-78c0-46c6-b0b7-dd05d15faac3 [Achaetomium macrosporum]